MQAAELSAAELSLAGIADQFGIDSQTVHQPIPTRRHPRATVRWLFRDDHLRNEPRVGHVDLVFVRG